MLKMQSKLSHFYARCHLHQIPKGQLTTGLVVRVATDLEHLCCFVFHL